MIQKLVVRLLKKIVAELPHRTITALDGSPYLTRWYLWPGRPRSGDNVDTLDVPFAVFIHYFHRGDHDRDQHDHPWSKSISLILAGGYREERGDHHRIMRPGMINVLRSGDYHRVDLLEPKNGSWSLFIAGKNIGSWGFRDEDTGEHIPHEEYFGRRN